MEATIASFTAASRGHKLIRAELVALDAADGSDYLETLFDEILPELSAELIASRLHGGEAPMQGTMPANDL